MKTETAIQLLRPDAEWTLPFGSVSASEIIWHDGANPISQDELDDMLIKPEPQPKPLTLEEKLAASGFTVDELKTLLGLK